ncbi:MAG: hypothetical protein ACI95X_002925, partial [Paraglaciecola sp.]
VKNDKYILHVGKIKFFIHNYSRLLAIPSKGSLCTLLYLQV